MERFHIGRSKRIIGGIGILGVVFAIVLLWHPKALVSLGEALSLSQVMLVGLALVVALMAGLVLIYSVIGLEDKSQALGLPEGSVRALIAFSLVLSFVCLAAFLYSGLNSSGTGSGAKLHDVDKDEIADLKSDFIVTYEPALKDGVPIAAADGKSQLYDVTFFPKHNSSADDFAKQIFTTLATVFVSVISFYFGSATTTSGVSRGGAMAAAVLKDPDLSKDPATASIPGGTAQATSVDNDKVAGRPP